MSSEGLNLCSPGSVTAQMYDPRQTIQPPPASISLALRQDLGYLHIFLQDLRIKGDKDGRDLLA